MTYLVTWPQYKKMAWYLERWTSTEGQVKKERRQNELKLGCVILSCSMVLLSLCRILYPKELWICFVPTKKRIKKLKCGIILLIFVLLSSNWFPLPSIQETLRSLAGLWTVWMQIPNPLLAQLFWFPYSCYSLTQKESRNSRT